MNTAGAKGLAIQLFGAMLLVGAIMAAATQPAEAQGFSVGIQFGAPGYAYASPVGPGYAPAGPGYGYPAAYGPPEYGYGYPAADPYAGDRYRHEEDEEWEHREHFWHERMEHEHEWRRGFRGEDDEER